MSVFNTSDCVEVACVDGECGFFGHTFMSRPESSVHDFLVVRKARERDMDEDDRHGIVTDVILMTFTSTAMVDHIRETLEWRIALAREHHPLDDFSVMTTDQRWRKQNSLFAF